MTYRLYTFKRQIEDIFIFPFVVLGRLLSKFYIRHNQYDIIFIFPFYHTGGAEKVHLELAKVFSDRKCLILFSRKSIDSCFKLQFENSGHTIHDISTYTDNKFQYWNNLIWRGIVSALLSSQKKKTILFNGQSNFGYKLSRWAPQNIHQIELIHSFNSFSWIRLPFISQYTQTVMISHKAINQHFVQYDKINVPELFKKRITYINNGIEIDRSNTPNKLFNDLLGVLYVGRATPEKRPSLFAQIAQNASNNKLPMRFEMAGHIEPFLEDTLKKGLIFHGNIESEIDMKKLYDHADILIVTSSEEGFPLVIMEAMSRGCIIISTPVGDIPYHVKNEENGFLFSSSTDEKLIVTESLLILQKLETNRKLLKQISNNNIHYANEEFEIGKFASSYRKLIEGIK